MRRLAPISCIFFLPAWSVAGPLFSVMDLGTLGGSGATASRINESGRAAGWSQTAGGSRQAFTHDGSSMSPLLSGGDSQANGINGAGLVVGSTYSAGRSIAALWNGSAFADLGTLGGLDAYATDINDAGDIAGSAATASGNGHAFLYRNGSMSDLGTLSGAASSAATAINGAGQVAGWSQWDSGMFRAFLWSAESGMTAIGGAGSYAMDINDAGQVTGHAKASSGYLHAFLYSEGSVLDLGTLGGGSSYAYGLNNWGHVVGYSWTAGGESRAFLYQDGILLDLNSLLPEGSGWELLEAYGINDAGQIVGTGRFNGQMSAFRLDPEIASELTFSAMSFLVESPPIPTPEPATWILIGAGGAALVLLSWKRRRIMSDFPGRSGGE